MSTKYNKKHPMVFDIDKGAPMNMYWSFSPPQFCAPGRPSDIQAITDIMKKAKKFIYIAVMDYAPAIIYSTPQRYVITSIQIVSG